MKRRDFLTVSTGVALSVPAFKTIQCMTERDRIQRGMDALLDTVTIRPVLAAELKPSDDASNVWPVATAYLRMMAQAEGTFIPGRADYDPYRVLCGSRADRPTLVPADDQAWSKHPGFRWRDAGKPRTYFADTYPLRLSGGKVSTAAGSTQFIDDTWKPMRHDRGFAYINGVGEWAPENQDLATLYLTGLTGGHWWLRDSISKQGDHIWIDHSKWLRALRADSNQWASFKGANIGASTGQSTKPDWWMWSRFIYPLWEATGRTRHVSFPAAGYGMKNITDRVRWRSAHPVTGGGRMHEGTDVGAPAGTPLIAPEAGTVCNKETFGFSFVPDRDPSLVLRFFHSRVEDTVLDKWVPQGAVIGKVGPKDHMSTGPHLHFEVKAYGHLIDSWLYLGMSEWFLPE